MSTASTIMLRRNVKHTLRNPTAVFNAILFPIVIALMFVYVLGGAFSVGVDYIDYVAPGLFVMTIGYGARRPQAAWPGGARLAVNFVFNYEEGSEYSIQDGDGFIAVPWAAATVGGSGRLGSSSRGFEVKSNDLAMFWA